MKDDHRLRGQMSMRKVGNGSKFSDFWPFSRAVFEGVPGRFRGSNYAHLGELGEIS